MTFRFRGLVPALALLAPALAFSSVVHAQGVSSMTGNMAYPAPLPQGQVNVAAPTARDTGNMAYPASPGGVTERAPVGRDTGNMAYPGGRAAVAGTAPMTSAAGMPMGKAPPMRPDVAPTAAESAAAQNLSMGPSSAPIPYTDFTAPKPMGRKGMMMHRPMGKKVMAKKPMTKATKAAATPAATPAPAAK